MRQIRTRVWDKELNQWLLDSHAILSDGSLLINSGGKEWIEPADPERFVVTESTGLKDKDGTEIFEGDVFRYVSKSQIKTYTAEVKFSEGGFYVEEGSSAHWLGGLCSDERHEGSHVGFVIGNVHQNPELLEDATDE